MNPREQQQPTSEEDPVTNAENEVSAHPTAANFKAKVAQLARDYDMLVALNVKVSSLPSSSGFELPNGERFDRSEMRSYNTAFKNAIRNLATHYSTATAKKKRAAAKRPNKSLRAPSLFTKPLADFIRQADFGTAYVKDENGQCIPQGPLSGFLEEAKEGVIARGALISLLAIYYKIHRLNGPEGGKTIYPDEAFGRLAQEAHRLLPTKNEERRLGGEKPLKEFNPEALAFTNLSTITSTFLVPKGRWNEEQSDLLESKVVVDNVEAEREIISSTLKCLNDMGVGATKKKSPVRRASPPKPTIPNL